MKNIYIKLGDNENRGGVLVNLVRNEFKAGVGNFTGYRFFASDEEPAYVFKRWCRNAEIALHDIASATRHWETVRLFRNALGELTVQVVDLTKRSVRAEHELWLRDAVKIGFEA